MDPLNADTGITVLHLLVVGAIVLAAALGYFWAVRKAKNHPDWFREKIESPLDAAARDLAAKGWTPAQIDAVLTGWASRDLTSKAGAAYTNIPPEIIEAANKIQEYAKNAAPK